jgi:hypothetical protein
VAIPDDEILVDRLQLDEESQAKAWLRLLAMTQARGDLFTVQLHAERIPYMVEILRALLAAARQFHPSVWIARLAEIADWWERRGVARLDVVQRGPSRHLVCYSGPPEGTVLMRGDEGISSEPWSGKDRLAVSHAFELESERKPIVGLSARTSAAVRAFIAEEGFPWEIADGPARYGAYLDEPDDEPNEVLLLARLERAPGPLVRLWRWPNRAKSALALTGDIDSITLLDFARRLWERG